MGKEWIDCPILSIILITHANRGENGSKEKNTCPHRGLGRGGPVASRRGEIKRILHGSRPESGSFAARKEGKARGIGGSKRIFGEKGSTNLFPEGLGGICPELSGLEAIEGDRHSAETFRKHAGRAGGGTRIL